MCAAGKSFVRRQRGQAKVVFALHFGQTKPKTRQQQNSGQGVGVAVAVGGIEQAGCSRCKTDWLTECQTDSLTDSLTDWHICRCAASECYKANSWQLEQQQQQQHTHVCTASRQ